MRRISLSLTYAFNIHVNLDESGQLLSKTYFISAPASPTKNTQVIYDDINWNNEPAPLKLNTTNYPFLDPAY
jgi:hypothetical protein